MLLSADANASILDTGSTSASAQSAGKRKFTLSDGAISATAAATVAATIVDDASCGEESPARALKPATRPPTPAPPRMARHASTLLLIPQDRLPLDRPRMFPRTADFTPNVASSSLQSERNYGCAGTFLRRLSPFPRGG